MACQEKTLKLICAQEKSFITLARAANIINFFWPWFTDFHTKLECLLDYAGKLTNGKHSSLLRKSVIYRQKSFITLAPDRGWNLPHPSPASGLRQLWWRRGRERRLSGRPVDEFRRKRVENDENSAAPASAAPDANDTADRPAEAAGDDTFRPRVQLLEDLLPQEGLEPGVNLIKLCFLCHWRRS